MHVLVSGSTGLIGSTLVASLRERGDRVTRLVRDSSAGGNDDVRWDPRAGEIDRERLAELAPDGAVHLAGESVGRRWTASRKARIRESRVRGTRLLSETLAALPDRPRALVCASAVGYYGDRGDELLREDSPPGSGFLADVTRDWEEAADPAREAGIRTVHLRFGIVLSRKGGALGRMLTPFRLGLGGRLASGRQYMSWIALDDVVGAIEHALADERLEGPVNVVAPNPVTNAEFTRTLARVLRRPAVVPVPETALRLALGGAGRELCASQRADASRLTASGYSFRHTELEGALRATLAKPG